MISKQEYKKWQSRWSKLMNQYRNEMNIDGSNAARKAAETCGKEMAPPVSGDKFLSELAYARNNIRKSKAKVKTSRGNNVTQRYFEWCELNDFVPFDVVVAYFVDCTPAAVNYARNELIKKGYRFEEIEYGYLITRPKAKKTYSEEEIDNIVERKVLNILGDVFYEKTKEHLYSGRAFSKIKKN